MNFELAEEQRMLRDSIGTALDRQQERSVAAYTAWTELRDLGALALPFPEALGGLGGGPEEVMLVMEAIGRSLSRVPYLQSAVLAGWLLSDVGTLYGAQGPRSLVQAIGAGSARAALCLYEPGRRYALDPVVTQARRTENGWRLNGAKSAVFQADTATTLIVPAGTGGGMVLLLVPPGAEGLALEPRQTPDGQLCAEVTFAGVDLPGEAAIGMCGAPARLLAHAVDHAIVAVCAEMIGAMDALLALTVKHLGIRKQFGAPLGTFQAVQHRAADMLVAIEQARSMTYLAVARLDGEARQRTVTVAAAKAFVNRSARHVGQQAIQLHGGMGMTTEGLAGRYFQRLTTLELLFGDTDHHLAQYENAGGFAAAD